MKWFIKFLRLFSGKKINKKESIKNEPTKVETKEEVVEEKIEEKVEKKPKQTEEEKKKETIKSVADNIIKTKKEQDRDLFNKTLPLILKYEGGYVNDPHDPGGETNKGVIKTTYDKYRKSKGLPIVSVREITDDEVDDIYYNEYWLRGSCDKLFDDLAIIHFDSCVNTGIKQSAKFLQRSCGATDDGVIGINTLKAVAATDKKEIIKKYLKHRKDFYHYLANKKPTSKKFLKGWLKRVVHLEEHINSRNIDENPTAMV